MADGIAFPPFRSLQDFLTDAEFSTPTFKDPERMSNRLANNLIYYQTNYFLCAIVILLIVGTLYPQDLIIGAVSLTVALLLYVKILRKKDVHGRKGQASEKLTPVAVIGLVMLLLYMLGSILVFIWGVTVPVAVVFLHAACRKRNLKNKFVNVTELFKEKPTPMSIILAAMCQEEEDPTEMHISQ